MSERVPTAGERRLALLPAAFSAAAARQAGVNSRELARLLDAGLVVELSRGAYRQAAAPETAYGDLIGVSIRAPGAIVCGESALALHELIDEIPSEVHIAVARGHYRPRIVYPPTRVWQFEAATFDVGRQNFTAAPGEVVAVYGPARAVVDAMRLRHLVGQSLALHALGGYLRGHGQRGVRELLEYARLLDVLGPVRAAVEAVTA
jgi:predicted transcriptional regulator of viral defense system